MFETLPFFNDSLVCQLFMLMSFFVSRKQLTCVLGISTFLASQPKWQVIEDHDVTPFSPCRIFFHKIHHQNNTKCILANFHWLAW